MVRMRRPDLRWGILGFSSDRRSTEERRLLSISPEQRTGRPLAVSCAGGKKSVVIVTPLIEIELILKLRRNSKDWGNFVTEIGNFERDLGEN